MKKCRFYAFFASFLQNLYDKWFFRQALKNWGRISPGEATDISAQISRQHEVLRTFYANHGGLIIGDNTKLSKTALDIFNENGVKVWNVVSGELKAVVTVR